MQPESKLYKFSVNVRCGGCANTINNALEEYNCRADKSFNIENTYINVADKTITIKITNNQGVDSIIKSTLKKIIDDVGFKAVERPSFLSYLLKGIVGILSGSLFLGLSISGIAIAPLLLYFLLAGSSLLTLYLGKESYFAALSDLRNKTLTMDSLFSISTLIALGVSIAAVFFPWLPLMIDVALLIFGFNHIGKAITESINQQVNQHLNFRGRAPKQIIKKEATTGQCQLVAIHSLEPQDLIIVRSGEVIPVDGICESKMAEINNKIMNGQDLPQLIHPGSRLNAGGIVTGQDLTLRVTKPVDQSYLARLDAYLNEPGEEAPLEKWANKIMQYFIPIVLIVALSAAIALGVLFSPFTAIQCAIALLVSVCPCTFGLITPLAVKIGLAKAAADGVRIHHGKALQAAAEVDTVVFDLNGTLTEGLPRVTSGKKNVAATNIPYRYLSYLAAIEQYSSHPIANAIRHYIQQRYSADDIHIKTSHLKEFSHCGLVAMINGKKCIVGNRNLMRQQGFRADAIEKANIANHLAHQVIYFACDNTIVGSILLKDPLRKDAVALIKQLKAMGKEIHLCTGADQNTATQYAQELGIKHVAAEQQSYSQDPTIANKPHYLEKLKKAGRKPAMIGDAANDLPAMKKTFSIAIESQNGDPITQQQAAAVIHKIDNRLSLQPVITALSIGKQTIQHIKQNLAFSLLYNSLTVTTITLLTILGFMINPAIGAALMFLQAALLMLNAYRFQHQPITPGNNLTKPTASGHTAAIQQAFKISPEHQQTLNQHLNRLITTQTNTSAPQHLPTKEHHGTAISADREGNKSPKGFNRN